MFCRISEDHLNGPGSLAERLRALPPFAPPSGGWSRLHARLEAKRRRYVMAGGGFALAASVLIAVGVVGVKPDRASRGEAAVAAPTPQVAQLISRSQSLERELADAQPVVWSTGRQVRAQALEQKIRMIDAQLNFQRPDSAEQLWRDRVRTMNALVELRQPEAGPALHYASYQY
jgi:hypothetical protein